MTFVTNDIRITKPLPPKPLEPVYANKYEGEWLNYQLGEKILRKHYEPKQTFFREGGRAIVLGNGVGRLRFPLSKFNLSNQYKRLDTYNVLYGCNRAFTDEGELDFLIMTNRLLSTIVPKDIHQTTYATQEIQRVNPNMELIPMLQRMDAGAAAVSVACFHGADKVFLFGFDGQPNTIENNNIYAGQRWYGGKSETVNDTDWQENLYRLMVCYKDVSFYRVDANPVTARKQTVLPNYRLITFNDFVSLADL
jgi:hypothetical protein